MATDQDWIADLLVGYKQIIDALGDTVTQRNVLQIVGATLTDNPSYKDPVTEQVVGSTVFTFTGTEPEPVYFASLASLAATQTRQSQVVDAYSATTVSTGGGLFAWFSASTATPDGGTVSAGPSGTGVPGRWVRVFDGELSAIWYGVGTTGGAAAVTAAFQLWITAMAAQGAAGYIPAGTYTITNLALGHSFRIRGDGFGRTIINCTSTSSDGWATDSTPLTFCALSDLQIVGPSSGATNGLTFGTTTGLSDHCKIENVIVAGFGGKQANLINHSNAVFRRMYLSGGTMGLYFGPGGGAIVAGSNASCEFDFIFAYDTYKPMYVEYGYDNQFYRLYLFWDPAYASGVSLLEIFDCSNYTFRDCHFEPEAACSAAQVLVHCDNATFPYGSAVDIEFMDCTWWTINHSSSSIQIGVLADGNAPSRLRLTRPRFMTQAAGYNINNVKGYYTLVDRGIAIPTQGYFQYTAPTINNPTGGPVLTIPFGQGNQSGDASAAKNFTMAAAATMVIPDLDVTVSSIVIVSPLNAAAATLMGGTNSLYVSTAGISPGVHFTVATAAGGNAAGTELFAYTVNG